jgi:hypothetical protein
MVDDLKRRWAADVFDIDSDSKISGDGTDDKPIGVREIDMERWLIVYDLWAAVLPDCESPSSRRQWLVPGKHSTDENTTCEISLSVPREAEALQPLSLF